MANNYCMASDVLPIPADKLEQAKQIAEQFETAYEEDPDWGYLPIQFEFIEEGLWVYSDESFNPETAEELVRKLVEELEMDAPFILEYAFACSKPRCGEFGGGAFRVERGQETKWLNTGDLR